MKGGASKNFISMPPLFGALEYLKSKTQRVMTTGVFTNVNDLARNPIATQQAGHYNTPSSFVPELFHRIIGKAIRIFRQQQSAGNRLSGDRIGNLHNRSQHFVLRTILICLSVPFGGRQIAVYT